MAVLVLGRPAVRVGGVVRHPARRMVRILLGVLAVRANRALPLEWIIDALWPVRPPASAAANVRNHLAELRRLLGEVDPDGPGIVTSRTGYVLAADPDVVDVTQFQALLAEGRELRACGADAAAARCLTRAVGLWRGPVMAGAPVPDVVRPDVTVLDEQRLCAIEDLAEVRLALGCAFDLVPALAGLVVEHPLRERLWRNLVGALAAAGRRTEALAVYHRLVRVLDSELGVAPSAATAELYEAVRRDRRD
ncbi:AfsR/SARP family transcriptional regulator [Actinosynnema sp. NPDC047251]|uniref:Transcriptional regulator, SARP family n=1 Tax=Saccharothrix espanaensis (strain ATCC 51144 / DSM 44229 / JCM 9112 / NBRC 15066 / NRRL 15764) TaxID=1179773 RepID=K0K4D6_SACES|nr:AfsR/SARP family transcriptional regulator [Saccharothrix espanaensis]CCH31418.1 Transcriptional regulator, SARP family [Saccharothrix espanaensis DSM 44229]